MTTVELLIHCQTRKPQPCIPDLIWQRDMHRNENLAILCSDDFPTPEGFHDTCRVIIEPEVGY